jgi:hypothetical protein
MSKIIYGYPQELTYEINTSSPDNNTLIITATGGNEITYKCDLIRNDTLPKDKITANADFNGIKFPKTIDIIWTTIKNLKTVTAETEYPFTCPDGTQNHIIKYNQEINDPQKNSDIQRILDIKTLSSCESNTSLLLSQLSDCNQRNDQCQNEKGTCTGQLNAYNSITKPTENPTNASCQEQLLTTSVLLQRETELRANSSWEYTRCNAELTTEKDKGTTNMIYTFIAGLIAFFIYNKYKKNEGINVGGFGDFFTGRPPNQGAPPI